MTNMSLVQTRGATQVRTDSWTRYIDARIEYNARRAQTTQFIGERDHALSEIARYRDLSRRSEVSA
jgi:hypothetical protein